MIIESQKELFNIPADVTFLNCANMSPLPEKTSGAGITAINKRSNPGNITIDDWFAPSEELRVLFAKIIHTDKENIALIPAASYGIAIAANNISLTSAQKIIVLDQQFPSNIYAWRQLAAKTGAAIITVERKQEQSWTDAIIESIDQHTAVVAIPNCHWTDGSLIDLEKVSEAVKNVAAKLVIDASQSAGAYPLNIQKIKPDFLVTAGYKWLLGPYGLGYLYADDKYCETGKPIEFSWLNKMGSEDFTSLVDYTDEYKPGARRFDMGEFPSLIHLPMAIASLQQIIAWGVENIQETIAALTDEIEERAVAARLATPKRSSRAGHMTGIQFSQTQVAALSTALPANKIYISFRGTNMRIAPHLYNDKNDIDKLFNFMEHFKII